MVQEANTTVAVDEQVYGANLFGAGNDAQEEISGPVPGGNTTEVSTFAYDGQVYGEDLSGITEDPEYLLGNVEGEIPGPVPETTADASTLDIDGHFYGGLVYGEDLSGITEVPAYLLPGNVEGEISGPVPESTADASTLDIDGHFYGGLVNGEDLSGITEVPAYLLPGNVEQGLGDWAQCSSNSQCSNGCCSDAAVADVFKCTPLSGDFNPSICTAV